MTACLARASPKFKASYVEALREGFRRGDQAAKTSEETDQIEADFAAFFAECTDRTGLITTPTGERIPKVPFDVFWLVDGETFIGEASVRYELNDLLLQIGGHVGYGIRPKFQRQRYGTLILKLALDELGARAIDRALVTCYDHNIGSAKIIEANGGKLENLIDDPRDGGKSRRYWIDLSSRRAAGGSRPSAGG
jgi:predicted acetyltransferase